MGNDLVTIGLIAERDSENTVYAINSILGQNYPSIELIVSVDKVSGSSVCDIVDCLNSNRKDNIKKIDVNCTMDYWGIERHVEYIYEKSSGKYITFVKNTEGYYDNNAVNGLILKMKQSGGGCVGKGKTVLFDASGNYLGDAESQSCEGKRSVLYVKEKFVLQSVFNKPLEECYSQNEIVDTEVPFLRSVQEEVAVFPTEDFLEKLRRNDDRRLNYSRYLKIMEMLKRLKKDTCLKVKPELLAELGYLQWKEENGYWKLTDADIAYGKILLKLLDMIQRKSLLPHLTMVKRGIMRKIRKTGRCKLRLVFFAQEYSVWPSMQSVYEAALKDGRYEADLVFVPFSHHNATSDGWTREYEEYKGAGYDILKWSEYNLSEKSPDIAFFVKPYDGVPEGYYIDEIIKVIDRCIYLNYGIHVGVQDNAFVRLQYQLPMYVLAWKVVIDSLDYYKNFCVFSYVDTEKCWKIGNPRLDFYAKKQEETPITQRVRELAGDRKIILWNSHHTIAEDGALGTFLTYSSQIIDYAKRNNSLFFVWRPHPLFFGALQKCMMPEEYNDLWSDIEKIENLIVDREKNYQEGFYLSDAMVSDYSALVKEYVLLKKPLLIMHKTRELQLVDCQVLDLAEQAYDFGEVEDFLKRMTEGTIKNRITEEDIAKEYYFPVHKTTVAEELLDMIADKLNASLL